MAEHDTKNPPRTIGERYTSAGNSSDLTVTEDVRGDGDMLIASGWSRSRIGGALLRLHSEWDGAEHPVKPATMVIERIAAAFALAKDWQGAAEQYREHYQWDTLPTSPPALARALAYSWYYHEVRRMLQQLKSLPAARHQLELWYARSPLNRPDLAGADLVAAVIRRWLDHTCTTCHGQKWELIPGTARLSAKACRSCRGTGEAQIPYGQTGRAMLVFMEECMNAHAQSMAGRFRHQTPAAPASV